MRELSSSAVGQKGGMSESRTYYIVPADHF